MAPKIYRPVFRKVTINPNEEAERGYEPQEQPVAVSGQVAVNDDQDVHDAEEAEQGSSPPKEKIGYEPQFGKLEGEFTVEQVVFTISGFLLENFLIRLLLPSFLGCGRRGHDVVVALQTTENGD